MARAPTVNNEPRQIDYTTVGYVSQLSYAFNWYNQEKDKKDAISYLREYIKTTVGADGVKQFDKIPDNEISTTYGWVARMHFNGCQVGTKELHKLDSYVKEILVRVVAEKIIKVKDTASKPSVQDYMLEKVSEYLGELEGALDDYITAKKEFDLYKDLQARAIPKPYCTHIEQWVRRKAQEYITVYESTDPEIKEAYSNFTRPQLTRLIKLCSQCVEDVERYGEFKKANRKPRVKKQVAPGVQVAKLKYMREFAELGLKSVMASEIVGASQVWVYNTKYKRLAAYRTESTTGLQVKGTTLQNYDPDMCEQKALRKPAEVLKKVLTAGKVQLRRILPELTTKETPVNGRINEECIIIRVIK